MRISQKVSQETAAKAAGCSDAAIGHYENGRMEIPENRLRRLITTYGYSYEIFMEYINGKPIPIIDVRDDCLRLLSQVDNEDKLRAIHTILKNFAS